MAARHFAWVLNLDAELELLRPTYTPDAKLLAQLERHALGSHSLLGPEDVRVGAASRGLVAYTGRAWCPTPRAVAALAAAGAKPEPYPAVDVLRRVNHRLFAHELGGGLPQREYVRTRSELEALLACGKRPWLLKRPLSFAGRGQLRAYGELSVKDWSWVDASFRCDGLLVEPLVSPTLEVSVHGFIWPDGSHELGRICLQDVSPRGVFRGIRLAAHSELESAEQSALNEQAERAARALTLAGYFGPFGIDGYRFELDGRRGFCALGEINARYTMGFAAGFPRHPSELAL